jgi:hypothetical protein
MTIQRFAVTYDYRCPFARNAHEHLLAAIRAGAPWEVEFIPFSLTQAHVEEGRIPVWKDPDRASDLLSIEAGLVVKEREPDRFGDVHLALFSARHDEGLDLRSEKAVRGVLEAQGVDANSVFEAIAEGWPRDSFRKAHETSVETHSVFGVPTFIVDDDAVFVRIMTRPSADPSPSISLIQRVLDLLVGAPELNEFKHPKISN